MKLFYIKIDVGKKKKEEDYTWKTFALEVIVVEKERKLIFIRFL